MREDPGLYDYWPYEHRPKIEWPGGAKLAFWVAPNIEFYELAPPPNPYRTPWPRPVPDVPGYSYRDYGNRVGNRRLAAVLDRYDIRASVSLSVAICEQHPELIEMGVERNWEFFSHGIYNTRYSYGMSEEQEREIIRDAMATIERHTGQQCAGYLAPSLTHTERTVDLFAEEGGLYTCDLFHDDQPTPLTLRSGRRFVSIPYSLELNDSITVAVSKVEPRRWGDMIKRSFDRLYQEGEESGTVMCIPVHGYQVAQPHRLGAFEEAIDYITGHDGVWVATGREIAQWYVDHHWDEAVADIASRQAGVRRDA